MELSLSLSEKIILIGKIKGLAEEAKRTNIRMHKDKKYLNAGIQIKLQLGKTIRHYLLAYNFIKGRHYNQCERNHAHRNEPDANQILKIIKDTARSFWKVDVNTKRSVSYDPKVEDIKSWLSGASI
jgi:hypothetical protein